MEERIDSVYVKRTQKDYSMSLKMQVIQEVERGEISLKGVQRKYGIQGNATVINWLRKYGTFDWENQTPSHMPKSQEQKILELEQKVKLLEKQKAFLEHQIDRSDRKSVLFDMMIELAEKEFNIPIRKKCLPGQSTSADKKEKKQ
jgi:transposase